MSKTAFVFPGQGSQSLGMLADFAERVPVRQAFQEASGALDLDLWQLAQEGPEEALNSTENTQPLLLTAGVALWKLWEQAGGARPDRLAGHSLGEYTALTCAGVITLGDAVRLVRRRGELMQAAVADGEGRMAAILGLDDDQVRQACADAAQGEVVEAVNFNAPGQVLQSGPGGSFALLVDLTQNWPVVGVLTPAVGETWHFQAWFRDLGPTSNFTDALALTFN